MKTPRESFREIFAESKKQNVCDRFWDAVEQYEKKHNLKAPYKNPQSFKSSTSYHHKS